MAYLTVLDPYEKAYKRISIVDNGDGTFAINTAGDTVFNTMDVDTASATVTYIGKEAADATWMVMKIDTSSGTAFSYATITNNSGYTTYSTAWTARASLTYNSYSVAF